MNKFTTLMLILCFPFIGFSQEKSLNKALKKGKNPTNLTYSVEYDKYYDMNDVSKWMSENQCTILQSSTAEFSVFNDTKMGYDKVIFMANYDYNVFVENARRIAEQQRRDSRVSSSSSDWSSVIPWLIGGAMVYFGGKWVLKNAVSSNPSTSTNDNTPEYELVGDWGLTLASVLVGNKDEERELKIYCKGKKDYHSKTFTISRNLTYSKPYKTPVNLCSFGTDSYQDLQQMINATIKCACKE